MPELPEVECIRRGLLSSVVGSQLSLAALVRRDVVVASSTTVIRVGLLDGVVISDVRRKGKQLAVVGESGRCLVVQLGMTGSLLLRGAGECVLAHSHVTWRLKKLGGPPDSLLVYRDPRRFGRLTPLNSIDDLEKHWSKLGPDALSVSGAALFRATRSKRVSIKALLLDQSRVAGVGNIYADEALFSAHIHPARVSESITSEESGLLARALRLILKRSIRDGGSTISDHVLPDGSSGSFAKRHLVYGRAGTACRRCGTTINKAKMAGRTTVWCPLCQRVSRRQQS